MEEGPGERPLVTGCSTQEDGELCLNSIQCKSRCCHRSSGLSLARCKPKASENSECSAKVSAGGLGVVRRGWREGRSGPGGPWRLEDGISEECQCGPPSQQASKHFRIPWSLLTLTTDQ